MTTEATAGEGTVNDDFDAAFEEAIAAAASGEPASGKPGVAAGTTVTDGDAAAAVDASVDADEAADKAKADKEAADAAAAKEAADKEAAAAAAAAGAKDGPADMKAASGDATGDADSKAAQEAADKKAADDAAAAKAKADKDAADAAAAKAKADKDAADKKAADDAAATDIKDPVLSDDDKAVLAEFEKEWPAVAPAVTKMMEHQAAQLEARFARTLLAVVGKLYQDFTPAVQGFQEVAATSFRSKVLAAHDDYDAHADKLQGWIATQPAYLQKSMLEVYNGGSAEDLIDLVSRYKQANGVSKTGANTQTTDDAAKQEAARKRAAALAAEEAARKAAAASTRPVAGTRATPSTSGVDPNDYDAAFDEAVAAHVA